MEVEKVIMDCPACYTRNVEMTLYPGTVTGVKCGECGKMWAQPQLEIVQEHTPDSKYD